MAPQFPHADWCQSKQLSSGTYVLSCNCGGPEPRVVYAIRGDYDAIHPHTDELKEEIERLKKENHRLQQQVFAAQRSKRI